MLKLQTACPRQKLGYMPPHYCSPRFFAVTFSGRLKEGFGPRETAIGLPLCYSIKWPRCHSVAVTTSRLVDRSLDVLQATLIMLDTISQVCIPPGICREPLPTPPTY